MKKIFLGFAFVLGTGIVSVNAQSQGVAPTTQTNAPAAGISFKEADNTHDFGVIPQGTPVSYTFMLTNTGKVPLVLTAVNPSCGCTSPEWPKDPIAPGKSAPIKVTYNAAGIGTFTKNVTVVSNAATPNVILYIKGEQKAPAASTASQPAPAAASQSAAPKKN